MTVPRVRVLCMGKTDTYKLLMGNLCEMCVLNYGENGRIILRCIRGKLIHEVDVELDLVRV